MKKKILGFVLAVSLTVVGAFALTGCSGGNEMSREQLSSSFKEVSSAAYSKLGFEKEQSSTVASLFSIPEVGSEVDINGMDAKFLKANAIACVALVDMVGDLYANEDFVVTDNAVTFTISNNNKDANLTILPKLDKVANKAELQMVLDMSSDSYAYYYFDMNYDFEAKTLNSFTIHIVLSFSGKDSYQCQRMVGDKFYMTDNPEKEYVDAVAEIKTDYITKKQAAVVLTASFQKEFDVYTAVSQKAMADAMAQ